MASGIHHRPTVEASSPRPPVATAAFLLLALLALVALGCSTSPDDDSSPAVEASAPTTAAAQPTEPTTTQPEQSQPSRTTVAPTTTASPATTTSPAVAGDEREDGSSEDHEQLPDDSEPSHDPAGQLAPCDGTDPPEQILAPRLVLWGDGFLEVGYPASAPEWDRTRLAVRSSADGITWSAIETCPFPFAAVPAPDTSQYPIASATSNGHRLVLTMPLEDRVLVSTTSDLSGWETFEVVPAEPDGLPYGVRADTQAGYLAIGPHGWLLSTSTRLGVDLWVLAPADIRESAQDIRFGHPESEGLTVEWWTEQEAPDEFHHSRFVTWEELGIDEDTYFDYGVAEYANKPYTPSWLISAAVWAADWGEEPTRTELPSVSGAAWWRVRGTDAGFIAMPRIGEPGYPPAVGVDRMYFSPDGLTWDRIDAPGSAGVSLAELVVVKNGILVVGDVSEGAVYNPIKSQMWFADTTGSNWRAVELPGLPERSWINIFEAGHGVVGWSGLTEGDWRAQWIVGSINGVDWLVMEHPTPRELWMTIIGDVMLVTDGEGNTQRFLIP